MEVDWYDVDPTSQARVRAPMPPILGGVTYQRLCSDFAKCDNSVFIVAGGSGLRGQVGVEGLDIGTSVELLRDPMHEVMLIQVSQGTGRYVLPLFCAVPRAVTRNNHPPNYPPKLVGWPRQSPSDLL